MVNTDKIKEVLIKVRRQDWFADYYKVKATAKLLKKIKAMENRK